ncbi:MAG: septal ring lytic transglycosylase RlpA family protein [Cyanobacteria bacterium RI_101]|nr:septal ring lytic transglycosylase RlpA family protein [Cyanobacteria bacterium RI_101]
MNKLSLRTLTLPAFGALLTATAFGLSAPSALADSAIDRNGSTSPVATAAPAPRILERQAPTVSPASLLPHTWRDGRLAVTLRFNNIPVATFLGSALELKAAQDLTPITTPTSAYGRAQTAAERLEALAETPDFNAETIRANYDKTAKLYQILIGDEVFLSLNADTVLPDATAKAGHNALQMANRLRRLLGSAPPLTAIAGKPAPTQVALQSLPSQLQTGGPNFRRLKTGMASWYGPGFHGRRTANGERYNQHGLTAAHRSLPFGTRVRVTNLYTGQSVVVRINDRGPFIGGRVIDLSAGAAKAIGVYHRGTARVALDILQ